MNSGYLSVLLICMLFALLASGWRGVLFPDVSVCRLSLLLAGLVIGCFVIVPYSKVQVHLMPIILIGWIGWTIFQSHSLWNIGQFLSIALLAGLIDFGRDFLQELLGYGNTFSVQVFSAFLMAVLFLTYAGQPLIQMACLSCALLLADGCSVYFRIHAVRPELGGTSFQDHWWLSFLLCRLISVLLVKLEHHSMRRREKN